MNKQRLYSVGVDLGGTNIRAAVVDMEGRIHAVERTRVGPDCSPQGVIARCSEVVNKVLDGLGLTLGQMDGVGIGVPGPVVGTSGIVAVTPNLGWKNIPLGQLMSDKLCCPVRIVNDLNAIAWGEATCGAAKGYNCVLVVYVGTGIGAGLILDGKLYTGSSGIAAEIGHVKVCEENGAPCGCGGRGCLEAYVGGGNLSARLRTEAPFWPALSKEAGGRLDAIHPGLVEVLFQRKDERAKHLWKDLGTKLGLVLANAVTLINPGALVLGGTVLDGCPSLRKYTEQVLENRAMPGSWKSLVVLSAKLGDNAGIIGAAMLGLL